MKLNKLLPILGSSIVACSACSMAVSCKNDSLSTVVYDATKGPWTPKIHALELTDFDSTKEATDFYFEKISENPLIFTEDLINQVMLYAYDQIDFRLFGSPYWIKTELKNIDKNNHRLTYSIECKWMAQIPNLHCSLKLNVNNLKFVAYTPEEHTKWTLYTCLAPIPQTYKYKHDPEEEAKKEAEWIADKDWSIDASTKMTSIIEEKKQYHYDAAKAEEIYAVEEESEVKNNMNQFFEFCEIASYYYRNVVVTEE